VLKLAEPPLRGTEASTVVPFLKVTISPSGGNPEAELTVAVKVTVCPTPEGLLEEASTVLVAGLVTVSVSTEEVLERKLELPLYTAVMP
jgi:hypothetical protein